ncbi:MAG: hypothetical protein ABW026_12335, partial [Microvirga sp.]
IDEPLLPDPDADEEMGAADVEAVADADLQGSRLLLVRRAVEPIDLEGIPGGVVQLACTFQPAAGTRFTFAQFVLRLSSPPGLRITDLAPRSVDDANPVEFTLGRKGQLGVTGFTVEPSVELSSSRKFVRYHCKVQGSGEGTSMARWDFRESPDRRDGIGQEQILTLTLPVTGPITGEVIVAARLARSGLEGSVKAFRDLVLGRPDDSRSYPISFTIPSSPSPGLLQSFLRML